MAKARVGFPCLSPFSSQELPWGTELRRKFGGPNLGSSGVAVDLKVLITYTLEVKANHSRPGCLPTVAKPPGALGKGSKTISCSHLTTMLQPPPVA